MDDRWSDFVETFWLSIDVARDTFWKVGHATNKWLIAHDQQLNLALGWILCVGFGILSAVKGITWNVIRHQHDESDVGRKLKRQKLFETFLFAALSGTYGIGLTLYYRNDEFVFSVWERLGIRFIVAVGMMLAVLGGIAFVQSLKMENWGQADRENQMDARDVAQDARGLRQDRRESRQDTRESKIDSHEAQQSLYDEERQL